MKWADKIDMRLSSPATAARVSALLGGRLVVTASASRPQRPPRVLIVADEVDAYPASDTERSPLELRTRREAA